LIIDFHRKYPRWKEKRKPGAREAAEALSVPVPHSQTAVDDPSKPVAEVQPLHLHLLLVVLAVVKFEFCLGQDELQP
jgi:hypothetical protein